MLAASVLLMISACQSPNNTISVSSVRLVDRTVARASDAGEAPSQPSANPSASDGQAARMQAGGSEHELRGDAGADKPWHGDRIVNILDGTQSPFRKLLEGYVNVNERMVTFPEDSASIGRENREIIEDFLVDFEFDTDVVHLLGCSNGNEADGIKHDVMARQRGANVRQVLIRFGVPASRIYVDGCWKSGESDLHFPQRAVLLTLKRLR
ncbi:MAG: hypothetical protein CSB44_12580 [Gammaproteobacteria bacterium]|nr:MAG: hypothetical protein CSB44_12580 [Gammaproteobacteria bacterium]